MLHQVDRRQASHRQNSEEVVPASGSRAPRQIRQLQSRCFLQGQNGQNTKEGTDLSFFETL